MTILKVADPDLARDEVFEDWGKATAALFEKALQEIDGEASLRVAAALEAGGSFAMTATLGLFDLLSSILDPRIFYSSR